MEKKLTITFSLFLLQLVACEHIQFRIRRGEIPMRGANLGGWLVAEHWMTSDSVIWQGVPENICNQGEFQTMKYLGHAVGDSRFEQHRQQWITEADITEIKQWGLNTVRVPIGYWIAGFDNHDPSGKQEWKVFAPGALKYLDKLIKEWANTHDVAVLISIHAAKGSQNGNDHSAPTDPGKTYWASYPENVDNTLDLDSFLSERYKDDPAFLGIGLLNEPAGTTTNDDLKSYYNKAYSKIRTNNGMFLTHAPLLWEQSPNFWSDYGKPPTYYNYLHEWHEYLIWGYEGWSEDSLMTEGIDGIRNNVNIWKGNWLFIGEWSVATTPPFNDVNKFRKFAKSYFDALRGAHAGWTYWTWKISGDLQGWRACWSLRNLLHNGDVLPSWFAY